MKNALDKLLEMIKMIKEENRNLIKNYNDQVDVIDEYLTKRNEYLVKKRALQKENITLQNELTDQKFALRTMRQKLKTLETAHDRTRNVRDPTTSSFRPPTADQEMTAGTNASDRPEKTKRSAAIPNSTIFTGDKAKFEH
jgi:chromosome segregation ATPase